MTKKLFWKDPYQTSNETFITSVKGPDVSVEETVFYAFSGGQESDRGTIGSYQVVSASRLGRKIEYRLSEDHLLKQGDTVTVRIEWGRRYRLMRLHFAAEIVLELMYKSLQGVQKIGAHIGENKARIDFRWPESISSLLPEIAVGVDRIVESNRVIRSFFINEENERRCWEVDGFAQVACGGTHLKKTGEVGDIRLKRKNIGKGKERVEIFLLKT